MHIVRPEHGSDFHVASACERLSLLVQVQWVFSKANFSTFVAGKDAIIV